MTLSVLSEEYHNKPIRVEGLICGKSIIPYCVPKTISIVCDKDNASITCKFCSVFESGILNIEPTTEDILRFVDTPSSRFYGVIKEILKINCKYSFSITNRFNVERIFLLPPIGQESQTNLAYISYYVGSGLEVNCIYDFTGSTTVDPKTQAVTHLFTGAVKVRSSIDSFKRHKKHSNLSIFSIDNPTAEKIFANLENLYNYYACNITNIYNRFDLHLAIDLVTKSALKFNLGNDFIHHGWMDAIIIGDTRCGKGSVSHKLLQYFGIGEVVSGENCSFAGLIGGLHQVNKNWTTSWGRIPLNDRGLVVIDEAGEIDNWSKYSRVRSEGIAEITKIHSQKTNARTRLLWLANPRNRTVASYVYGIESILDIIKTPEDIARFDYMLVISHNEVSTNLINTQVNPVNKIYNSTLEHDLILWTWSRSIDQIQFTELAVKEVLRLSIDLAKKYSFSIPLIQGENIRIKLSKISAAFAARIYSNLHDGEILLVDKVHVECAYLFLNMIYKKECSGYYAYSAMRTNLQLDTGTKDFVIIMKYLNSFGQNKSDVIRCLLSNNTITAPDLSEHLNLPRELSREIVSKLLKNSAVIKRGLSGSIPRYIKTPPFTSWLKRQLSGGEQ